MGNEITIDKVRGFEMKIKTQGVDLTKNLFHLHGVDAHGKVLVRKRLNRNKLLELMANLPPFM